ncbi:hypothetical protein ACCT09_17025 [Rhizobium ruizarguesonis]
MANLRKTISRIQARQTELGTELLIFTATGVRIKPDAFVCDLFELASPMAVAHLKICGGWLPSYARISWLCSPTKASARSNGSPASATGTWRSWWMR